jgi:hypothetical protein
MSVVGGLTHSALARLSKTNACIPSETQKVIHCQKHDNFLCYSNVVYQCFAEIFSLYIICNDIHVQCITFCVSLGIQAFVLDSLARALWTYIKSVGRFHAYNSVWL